MQLPRGHSKLRSQDIECIGDKIGNWRIRAERSGRGTGKLSWKNLLLVRQTRIVRRLSALGLALPDSAAVDSTFSRINVGPAVLRHVRHRSASVYFRISMLWVSAPFPWFVQLPFSRFSLSAVSPFTV